MGSPLLDLKPELDMDGIYEDEESEGFFARVLSSQRDISVESIEKLMALGYTVNEKCVQSVVGNQQRHQTAIQ